MSSTLESLMYQIGQIFLIPTLLIIAALFLYSLYALGVFATAWFQRRKCNLDKGIADLRCCDVLRWAAAHPDADADARDVAAHRMLEAPRIVARISPMMGLVATMIPMGPALRGLSDGNLMAMSGSLSVAFSAVIVALITASIMFWVASVRQRWLAEEIAWLQAGGQAIPPASAQTAPVATAELAA